MKSQDVARRALAGASVLALSVALAGCVGAAPGGDAPAQDDDGPTVGLFVANAFGDRAYYDSAAAALPILEEDFGATVSTYEAKLDAQAFVPLLQDAADANEIVFVVGDQAVDAAAEVAGQNPDTTFVFINGTQPKPELATTSFDYSQICYPGGVFAGLIEHSPDAALGFITGFSTPALQTCEAAFKAGAEAVEPGVETMTQVAGTFADPNKGYEIANALSQRGAYAIYSAAGLTTQGVVKAAADGADFVPITQDYGGGSDGVGASVVTHVEVLLVESVRAWLADELEIGTVTLFGYGEGAVEWSFDEALLGAGDLDRLQQVIDDIASGKLDPKA